MYVCMLFIDHNESYEIQIILHKITLFTKINNKKKGSIYKNRSPLDSGHFLHIGHVWHMMQASTLHPVLFSACKY